MNTLSLAFVLLAQVTPPLSLRPPTESSPAQDPPAELRITPPASNPQLAPPPIDLQPAPSGEDRSKPRSSPLDGTFQVPWSKANPSVGLTPPSDPRLPTNTTPPAAARDVIQAGGAASSISSEGTPTGVQAASIIKDALAATKPGDWDGEPVALVEIVRRTYDAGMQQRAVSAYWRLALAIAEHRFSAEEVGLLQEISQPEAGHDRAVLVAARSAAEARAQVSQVAVAAAQWDLVEMSSAQRTDVLPWPSDVPLVGPYRTSFETLFRDRPAPRALQRIDRMLPRLLKAIEARANSVGAAQTALADAGRAYQQGQIPVKSLLESLDRLRAERQAFLAHVLDYNQQIAAYSFAVVGPSADASLVVSTLIKRPSAAGDASSGVRQASAEEPVGRDRRSLDDSRSESAPAGQVPTRPSDGSAGQPQPTRSVLRNLRVNH